MSLPPAALQKLLQEVEVQAVQSQQKIAQTQAEINARKREARLNQLTSTELSTLPKDNPVYEGVGKMFVAVPIGDLSKRLTKESTVLSKEITELEKKLHYQETTFKNSNQYIEKILQSGARGTEDLTLDDESVSVTITSGTYLNSSHSDSS